MRKSLTTSEDFAKIPVGSKVEITLKEGCRKVRLPGRKYSYIILGKKEVVSKKRGVEDTFIIKLGKEIIKEITIKKIKRIT